MTRIERKFIERKFVVPKNARPNVPTISWRVEWYLLNEAKCDCAKRHGPHFGFHSDEHDWSECHGYEEEVEYFLSEEDAKNRVAEIQESVDWFHPPRLIKCHLEFYWSEDASESDSGCDIYLYQEDPSGDYQYLDDFD